MTSQFASYRDALVGLRMPPARQPTALVPAPAHVGTVVPENAHTRFVRDRFPFELSQH